MANLMNSVKLSVKPSRNGFDLSFKNNFTAKAGEIRPCFMKTILPGDKWSIGIKSFTRLQPVNTAAFARMREYYDFYFVPFEQLWNKFDSVITQMKSNLQHASGPYLKDNVVPSGTMPYVSCEQLARYVSKIATPNSYSDNMFGYNRAHLTCILLEYLGYGNYYPYLDKSVTWDSHPMSQNLALSIFPLLAYQKVYADYFRYTQWEKTNPSTFNVDYIKGTDDCEVDILSPDFIKEYNFLDLRYCNFNKDLFFGVLPNAQYGEEAVIENDLSGKIISLRVVSADDGASAQGDMSALLGFVRVGDENVNFKINGNPSLADFSILALRQAEALQRWKEVAQSVDEDYKSQIEAQWGVKVSDFLSHQSRYIGGIASSLDINPVVNQNITGDNGADIAGIGTVVNNGNISFESKGEYGIIIGVYHAVPIFDYQCDGISSDCVVTHAADFPIPAFDSIGMEQVPSYLLTNPTYRKDEGAATVDAVCNGFVQKNPYLGYAPRYVTWKTSIDVARGAFTQSLKNWVIPFDKNILSDSLMKSLDSILYMKNDQLNNENVTSDNNGFMMWNFFKCNPSVLDTLFAVAADSTVDTDQLLISSFFDAKVVRNLDVNGLPY